MKAERLDIGRAPLLTAIIYSILVQQSTIRPALRNEDLFEGNVDIADRQYFRGMVDSQSEDIGDDIGSGGNMVQNNNWQEKVQQKIMQSSIGRTRGYSSSRESLICS